MMAEFFICVGVSNLVWHPNNKVDRAKVRGITQASLAQRM